MLRVVPTRPLAAARPRLTALPRPPPRRAAPRPPRAGEGSGAPPPKTPPKDDATLTKRKEELVKALRASGVDQAIAQRVLKAWERAGAAGDPDALRRVLVSRSLSSAATIALQTLIDAGAAYGAWTWGLFLDTPAGGEVPLRPIVQALSFALCGYFVIGVLSDLFTLGALSVAAYKYGANAGAVLAAVREVAGAPSGVSAIDRAAAAASTLKVVAALNEIADLLKSKAASSSSTATDSDGGAASTLKSLSALLTLARAEEKGFSPDALGLDRDAAADLASVFARYDANDDMVLQPSELGELIRGEGYDLTAEEEREALRLLDTTGDGVISFPEFADWFVKKVQSPPTATS